MGCQLSGEYGLVHYQGAEPLGTASMFTLVLGERCCGLFGGDHELATIE
jgi:hypothetical protein